MKRGFGKLRIVCLSLTSKELAQAIKGQHPPLEVQVDIKVAQEIEANDAVNAIFFRNGIAQGFDLFHLGISHAEGFEGYLGSEMSLRSVAGRKAKGKMKNAKVQSKNQKLALSKPADFYSLNCNFDFLSLNFNLVWSVIAPLPFPSSAYHQCRLHTNHYMGFSSGTRAGQLGWGCGLKASLLWGDLAHQLRRPQTKAIHSHIVFLLEECLLLPYLPPDYQNS